jgi:aryl-alcohol dehydrogenase-like predicted oxidoreductase
MKVSRRIGTSSLEVFPVALGTANFGWRIPGGRAVEQLDLFAELGGNLLDTADAYASGRSEQIIGTWMRDRANRSSIVVATKVGKSDDAPGLSRRSIRRAVEASLQRLQTDYIDLLYFHAEDPTVNLEESLDAVAALIDEGKVRVLGASNFSTDLLIQARVLASSGLPRFEAIALEQSLVRRDIVDTGVEMAATAQGLSLMPYFALAHGYLGRYRDLKSATYSETHLRRALKYQKRSNHGILKALDAVAMAHGVDISTIALAWSLAQPTVAATCVGVENLRELEALMYAPSLHLTVEQLRVLDRASRR